MARFTLNDLTDYHRFMGAAGGRIGGFHPYRLSFMELILGGFRYNFAVLCDRSMSALFALYQRYPSPMLSRFISSRIKNNYLPVPGLEDDDLVLRLLTTLLLADPDSIFHIRMLQSLIFLVGDDVLPLDRIELIEAHLAEADKRRELDMDIWDGPCRKQAHQSCLALSDQLRALFRLNKRQALGAIAAEKRANGVEGQSQSQSNRPFM